MHMFILLVGLMLGLGPPGCGLYHHPPSNRTVSQVIVMETMV